MELELLMAMKQYIEETVEEIDKHWGCRSAEQFIKENDMPEIYDDVCKAIENLTNK